MLSVRSRVRLISISSRSACGRPLPRPPSVATMQLPGMGESASPIVSSLCPPVYVCAVSIICTPAATAALISSTPPRVFASRFVPSPMRATSVSPNLMECSFMMLARPLSMCGPLGFRNRGEASDLRAIDVDLENVLHDHHPTVDEVPPPILDVEMPALLLAQRLIQKFEVSSVVELPRVACLGKTRAVGDRG